MAEKWIGGRGNGTFGGEGWLPRDPATTKTGGLTYDLFQTKKFSTKTMQDICMSCSR